MAVIYNACNGRMIESDKKNCLAQNNEQTFLAAYLVIDSI